METVFDSSKQWLRHKQTVLADRVQEIGKCERCGRAAGHPIISMTLDHIIPLQIMGWMGFDTERYWDDENLELVCRTCNVHKSNRLDFSNPKTKLLLLKYLSKI